MSSVYSEVTGSYARDRVLEKFDTAQNTLPYTLNDIKISHNDILVANVYNDAISKLYENYLFLISNSEITNKTTPTSALSCINLTDSYTGSFSVSPQNTTGSSLLSSTNEIFYTKRVNDTNRILFSYGKENNLIAKIDDNLENFTPLLSGIKIEHNKNFEFKNVTSVALNGSFLFVLDRGNDTLFKFDVSGVINNDPAIERTSLTSEFPGRYLLKTIGGKGKVNRKNKLNDPSSISIYENKIYVLDNGNSTIKIFDLNFNFIDSFFDKQIFNENPVSITVSSTSNINNIEKIFILCKNGTIYTLNKYLTNRKRYSIFGNYTNKLDVSGFYKELSNFKKIISSESDNNILYVTTNKSVIKLYKSDLSLPISFYDLSKLGFNSSIEKINSLSLNSINGVDNLALVSHLSSGQTKLSFFKDNNNTTKLYHDNFYTNYFSLSDIRIHPKELVNAVTFNKTTEKISYNHSSLFESLNKKIHAYYTNSRVPEISAVVPTSFTLPSSFNATSDFYIGVNEPLLTDVINRPITKLYNQQVDLFNSIKENFLNNNPPENVSEVLPITTDVEKSNIIRFSSDTPNRTIVSGNNALYKVIRTKNNVDTSFKMYTTLGTNTLSSDFSPYVDISDPVTFTFTENASSVDIDLSSDTIFYQGEGGSKSFTTFIVSPSGAVLDQTSFNRITTINPKSTSYTISMSAVDGIINVKEGSLAQLAVVRTDTNNLFTESASANIETFNITTTNSDYNTITNDGTYKGSINDFVGFSGSSTDGSQTSATSLSGGTIFFGEGVSAVFFSISANEDSTADDSQTFGVRLKNFSRGSNATPITQQEAEQIIQINDNPVDISLNLTTGHSNITNTNYVSDVNVWDMLSADTTYQANSAGRPINVTFTIAAPLSVYSTSVSQGALYFNSGICTINPGSILNLVIPSSSSIVGKGGAGGRAVLYLSGSDFDPDATSDSVSTTEGLNTEGHNSYLNSVGQDGGPAISLSGFSLLKINNSGSIYGGGGGGGSGFLPVTANPMASTVLSSASAGAAGGGGAGIITWNEGDAGNATFMSPLPGGNYSSLASNTNYVPASGTIGGYFSSGPLSPYNVTRGADGGSIGTAGAGGDQPDCTGGYHSSYSTVENYVCRNRGGAPGSIVSLQGTSWYSKPTDLQVGTFSGSDVS